MLKLSNKVTIPASELQWSAIRAQGSGGQNVNKVSSAVHLRFDIHSSSLPEFYRERLLALSDKRISSSGIIIIKAQNYRTQEKNRLDAIARLKEIILKAIKTDKKRIATRPTKASKKRRCDKKTRRGITKQLRGRVDY